MFLFLSQDVGLPFISILAKGYPPGKTTVAGMRKGGDLVVRQE